MKLIKVILICIISIKTNNIFGQNENIKQYYNNINIAELFIINNNYDSALSYYGKANEFKYLNKDDLINVFTIAFILKDSIKAKYYFDELALKGFNAKMFEVCNEVEKRFSICAPEIDSAFYSYLKKDLDSLRFISEIKMKDFGESFMRFYFADQNARKNNESDSIINILDKINETEILNYINKTSFPTFQNSGFWGLINLSPTQNGIIWLIAWHRRPSISILENLIFKKVIEGDYSPELYAIIKYGQGDDKYGIIWNEYKNKSIQEKKKINAERQKIYLESNEDYQKKVEFQDKDRRFFLVNHFLLGYNKVLERTEK